VDRDELKLSIKDYKAGIVMRATNDTSREGYFKSFITQAIANAVGTVVGGVILGGVAIRAGLIRLDDQVLNTFIFLGLVIAAATPAVIIIAIGITWLLNHFDPSYRERRQQILFIVIQGTLWIGLVAAVLTHVFYQLAIGGFDLEGFVASIPIFAAFIIAVFVVRAYIRGRLARQTQPDEPVPGVPPDKDKTQDTIGGS
jgi:hypothetical protein